MDDPRPRRTLESLNPSPAEAEAARPVSVQPSRRPARWKKPLLALGLLAGALLVWVVLVNGHKWYLMYVGLYDPVPPEEGPGKQRAGLATIFQDAKNLIRESKWTEAKARLLELQAMTPDYPSLSDYLQTVEQEITNQEHLTAARAALAQKKLEVTKSELDKVRSNTLMYEQVAQLRKELQDTADARVREARNLYDLNKQAEVIEIVSDVVAVFPKNEDAWILLKRSLSSGDPPFPPPVPPKPPWEQAVSHFAEGNISGAIEVARSCAAKSPRCKSGLEDMKKFVSLYKKLEDLDAREISRLFDLDKRLMQERGPSKHCRAAVLRAPRIFYKEASAARVKGQWARAVEYARRTLQMDPSHTGATTLLKELKTQARDVYLELFSLSAPPEDAIPKLRQVLAMTEPDDELHQKVRRRLEQLSR